MENYFSYPPLVSFFIGATSYDPSTNSEKHNEKRSKAKNT